MENSPEKGPERIPTKEEVLDIINHHVEGAVLVRELHDEQGLYLLEMKVTDKEEGEFSEYLYMRKGNHPNQNETMTTNISVIFYEHGIPVGGNNIAEFIPESGLWENIS